MLSTQLDQYGKTSLTWKHIKAWVMKNGQDLMLLKPDEFIYMQTESHGLMTRDGWITQTHRQPHVVEHKSRNTVRAAQSQQMSCLFWWVKMSLKKQNCVTLPDCWVLKLTNCLIPFPYYFLSYVDYVDTEKLIFF